MDESEEKPKRKISASNSKSAAWFLVTLLGVVLFVFTTSIAFLVLYSSSDSANDHIGVWAVNGFYGIVALSLILLFVRPKKSPFFRHFSYGIRVGIILYFLIIAGAIAGYYNLATQSSTSSDEIACEPAIDQYRQTRGAIVPLITEAGHGTGFAVNDNRTIITSYHVVEGSDQLHVDYASGRVGAKVIKTAPEYDLALLRIDEPTGSFFKLSSNYNVGDEVYVFGYPTNTFTAGPPSLSSGIISRVLDRSDLTLSEEDIPKGLDMVQTDAAINSGNSGGPLIGGCGVIGIVFAVSDSAFLSDYVGVVSEQNIGYAISAKTAAKVFDLPIDN